MHQSKSSHLIREVPIQLRPRERLLTFGEQSLSDHELLAIVLRTGTKNEHVLQLAMRVITQFEHLNQLYHASLDELQQIKGIGLTKAIEIKAVIELGRRICQAQLPKLGKIESSYDVGQWMIQQMKHLHQEHMIALFLNTKNEIICQKAIFIGTVNSAVAHPRESAKRSSLKR